jgi:phosphoserine phosphatase RsbU/P
MDSQKVKISLKYKLLALLTVIPLVSLGLYFFLATGEFKEDKVAYVHDSSAAVAKSLSTQVRAEVNSFLEAVKPIVANFDQVEGRFSETAAGLFNSSERLDAVLLFQNKDGKGYRRLGELTRSGQFVDEFMRDQRKIDDLVYQTVKTELQISSPSFSDKHLEVAYRAGAAADPNHVVIVGLFRAGELRSSFVDSKLYRVYLTNSKGQTFVGPDKGDENLQAFKKASESPLPDGSFEIDDNGEKLVGFSDVGLSNLVVSSIVTKKEALSAVDKLILKSVTFFIALISFTVIISLFASIQLTSSLRDLYEATRRIAKGEFDIKVESKSNDEVGGLADGFNIMASEVSRLMKETENKARMESELATVKLVQETLFPEPESRIGNFNIIGHFEPASECGGDWWNYSMVGEKLYLWIGDATGHGAPAAMVTSAAKSAATIVEDLPFVTPGKALEIMNKAIHETSKGRILMTFFVASIDLKTGEMIYANASHEPPYVIRKKDGAYSKKDLEPLVEASGARLGDRKDSKYVEARMTMSPGDTLLFYTDGIVDLQNQDGKAWGERGFVKSIVQCASAGQVAKDRMVNLTKTIADYRGDRVLVDDITLMMCQYEVRAA